MAPYYNVCNDNCSTNHDELRRLRASVPFDSGILRDQHIRSGRSESALSSSL